MTVMSNIGIIAGGGQFPLLFAKAAQKAGRKVMIVAHKGESWPELEELADGFCWVKLGQLGKIINFFKSNEVGEAVFVGTITKTRIFKDVLPDLKGLTLWNKIDVRQDDAILRAVAGVLEEEGVKILPSTLYLQELLFPAGVLTKKKPSRDQIEDIRFGWQTARAIGALDIGQCVVVRDRTVLAVEAIEGTDAAISRGGSLGREKAVVVKLKKPKQDFRFDLPAIGEKTIATMESVKAAVLAVEAGQSLLFDSEAMIAKADKAGIVVVGVHELEDGSLSF
ncbi:MAG: UDP-2,3-diacylglucosamine diphosphatase LpxI [Desulfobulbaceae bacterium]|nr:UDP-2,3-diacylglucosamine diphosphatase LpxI [Desulfobulbaceae bacterium]HIJ79429.1 UDP-2,3-diacylglucosamine diphosphatase LpxI [Deltaproteobacteria bacterium]